MKEAVVIVVVILALVEVAFYELSAHNKVSAVAAAPAMATTSTPEATPAPKPAPESTPAPVVTNQAGVRAAAAYLQCVVPKIQANDHSVMRLYDACINEAQDVVALCMASGHDPYDCGYRLAEYTGHLIDQVGK